MITKQTIPFIQPYLGKNARTYIDECFDSHWISSRGHFIPDFESAFADFVGTKYAVAVSNGTVALHLALIALGIGSGDEVIVPDLTFAATVNSVLHAGAVPVIVDVEPRSWNINPDCIREAVTARTKAIIPVHLYGYPCNMEAIMDISREFGLKVIEDAAEAHGAKFGGERVGGFGDVGTFSFYGNKIITTGEGGMCVTNDAVLHDRMLLLRDHGMNRTDRYRYDVVGYNYRMTNPQAALGLAQIEEIDPILAGRGVVEQWYKDCLRGCAGMSLREPGAKCEPVNWLFTCLAKNRDALISRLAENGIETRPMFFPLHTMDIYKNYAPKECAVSISLSSQGISLPTYFGIPHSFVERISCLIRNEEC